MTATTAFLSLLALFGGKAIEGFAIVVLAGVVVCTYSAIFISPPVLIYLGVLAGGRSFAEAGDDAAIANQRRTGKPGAGKPARATP